MTIGFRHFSRVMFESVILILFPKGPETCHWDSRENILVGPCLRTIIKKHWKLIVILILKRLSLCTLCTLISLGTLAPFRMHSLQRKPFQSVTHMGVQTAHGSEEIERYQKELKALLKASLIHFPNIYRIPMVRYSSKLNTKSLPL